MTESRGGLTLVVSLSAHPGQEAALREYEARAMVLLRAHGGRLEKLIRVEASLGADRAPTEVHVVWFPSEAHFEAYRNDARLADLAEIRARAIADSQILIGREADAYEGS